MEKIFKLKPGAAVFLAGAAAFLPLLALPFVFDDVMSVRDNPLLRHFSSLAALFSPDYMRVFRNEGFEPFTFPPIMLFGALSSWQPWGLHLLSLLAHAACSYAVYRLARGLLGGEKPALLAGLFFALHPAMAESGTAVLFTGTIFSALFFLWALARFVERDGADGPGGALLTGLLYGVSLLFKERAFSGLLLFALLPFLKPGGGQREFRRRLPELLALASFWAAALLARLAAGRGSGFSAADLDPAFLFARLAAYAKMACLPFWLSPAYQRTPAWGDPAGLAALAVAAGVLWLAFKYRGRGGKGYHPAAAGAALAGLLLLPYLNLLPAADLAEYLRSVFVSGRYLYLPLAGAAIVFAAALSGLRGPWPVAAAAAALPLFAWLSVSQQLLWRSDEAVWARAARLNPESAWAAYMLGSGYLERGLPGKARPPLERALALAPSRGVRSNALGALAAVSLQEGSPAEAERLAGQALRAWEYNYDAWNTFGAALAAGGKKEKALKAFEVAGSAGITGAAPLVNAGRLYLELGRPAEAAGALEAALGRGGGPEALELLCRAYGAAGRAADQAACLKAASTKQ